MTRSEADKMCFMLFGMSLKDYAKRIQKAWDEEMKNKETAKTA